MRQIAWLLLSTASLTTSACLEPAEDLELAPTESSPTALLLAAREARYRAESYDVDVDLRKNRIQVAVTLEITSDGECLTIPMKPAAETITLGGISIEELATHRDGKLTFCQESPFVADSRVELAVTSVQAPRSESRLGRGFTTAKSADGYEFTYLLSWFEGCDAFGPCDTQTDTFARHTFEVTHDKGWRVFCPGTIQVTEGDDANVTTCSLEPAAPSYSAYGLIASAAPWEEIDLGVGGDVRLQLVAHSDALKAAARSGAIRKDVIAGALDWLVELLGDYPYGDEIRFIEAPTVWSGFEHPDSIVIQSAPFGGVDVNWLHHVMIHELAHQWAGNQSTLATTHDFAWKEAMSEYLAYVYQRTHVSAELARNVADWKWSSGPIGQRSYPVPGDETDVAKFYQRVYGPGTMTLFRQLEVMFGEAAMLEAIDMLIGSGSRVLRVDDVRVALEASTRANLETYFKHWVYGSGQPHWPEASMEIVSNEDGTFGLKATITTADDAARFCTFKVRVYDEPWETSADFVFEYDLAREAYDYPPAQRLSFVPVSYQLDPEGECLIFDAANRESAFEWFEQPVL